MEPPAVTIESLQDKTLPIGEAFDPERHISRTTPDLEQPGDGVLPSKLVDKFGRPKTYLRISVTDRCNMSCTYCEPDEGVPLFQREDFLSFDHYYRVAEIGAQLGIRKIRVSGGEPTIRRGIVEFIDRLNQLDGIQSVAMTSNALLLDKLAQPLADAGLKTINISLDSLERERFARVTRDADFDAVIRGIDAAIDAGLQVKINVVALNDLTVDEAATMVEYGIDRGIEIRFIEFMPLCGTGWKADEFRPITGLIDALRDKYGLWPTPGDGGVAEQYHTADGQGKIGFIASLSQNFCGTCSRLRLTANGILRPCLFSAIGVDLRPLLLGNRSDEELVRAFHQAVINKPEGHGVKPEDHWAGGEAVNAWIRSTGG